jgi:hypothetical protein
MEGTLHLGVLPEREPRAMLFKEMPLPEVLMRKGLKMDTLRLRGDDCRDLLEIAHKILARTFKGDCPLYVTPTAQGQFEVRSISRRRRLHLNVVRDARYGWMFAEAKL